MISLILSPLTKALSALLKASASVGIFLDRLLTSKKIIKDKTTTMIMKICRLLKAEIPKNYSLSEKLNSSPTATFLRPSSSSEISLFDLTNFEISDLYEKDRFERNYVTNNYTNHNKANKRKISRNIITVISKK